MLEAIGAALPWIFMGVAILILTLQRDKRDKQEQKTKKKQKRILEGAMCMGMATGAALSFFIPAIPSSYGVSGGILLGIIIGVFAQKKQYPKS